MRARKAKKRPETPEDRFQDKLMEECRIIPGMMVKAERMPQGSMSGYRLIYIHASQLDPRQLETCLRTLCGSGSCLLRFVDETRQPLDKYGSLWVHLGGYDDVDDKLEEARDAATMDSLTVLADLAGKIRRNRLDPGMFDALKRYVESAPPDDINVIRETIRLMGEMREQEYQRTMKQRADAAKQLQTLLGPIVAEMQAAQGLECQTPAEPVSQGNRFPLGDCSPPIVGLSLERLNTHGIFQGLGKPQDKGEDDQ